MILLTSQHISQDLPIPSRLHRGVGSFLDKFAASTKSWAELLLKNPAQSNSA
jgi:hypothetical protein